MWLENSQYNVYKEPGKVPLQVEVHLPVVFVRELQLGYEIMGILKTREEEHGRERKRRELK